MWKLPPKIDNMLNLDECYWWIKINQINKTWKTFCSNHLKALPSTELRKHMTYLENPPPPDLLVETNNKRVLIVYDGQQDSLKDNLHRYCVWIWTVVPCAITGQVIEEGLGLVIVARAVRLLLLVGLMLWVGSFFSVLHFVICGDVGRHFCIALFKKVVRMRRWRTEKTICTFVSIRWNIKHYWFNTVQSNRGHRFSFGCEFVFFVFFAYKNGARINKMQRVLPFTNVNNCLWYEQHTISMSAALF